MRVRVLTWLPRQRKQGSVSMHPLLSTFKLPPLFSVNSIAQTAAWQLQRTDVRVNALCPGLIETGMTAPVLEHARQRGTADKVGQLNPLGRYGVAEGAESLPTLLYLTLGH